MVAVRDSEWAESIRSACSGKFTPPVRAMTPEGRQMRRYNSWFFMVFLTVACGGGAANKAIAEETDPAAAPVATATRDQEKIVALQLGPGK